MLNGKKAIVTGGSRGIGAGICKKLASMGCEIALIYNGSEEKAKEVQSSLSSLTKVEIYKCNVSVLVECIDTVNAIYKDFGSIDILINNAGITRDNLVMMMTEDDFSAVVDTNLKGAFNMIKACSRNFIKKKYGKIINISSVSGLRGLAGQANYSASKAGIIGLTKAVAKEFGGKNICCNAIAPGFIETDMTKDLQTEDFVKSIPLKRTGNPEDVANLAAFLADDASSYITGEVIRVDGGLSM